MARKMTKAVKKYAQEIASLGGKARADKLTPEQRSEIAKKAVAAREAKRTGKSQPSCETCDGKGFTNSDGSANNSFEGSDSAPVIQCRTCNGSGQGKVE